MVDDEDDQEIEAAVDEETPDAIDRFLALRRRAPRSQPRTLSLSEARAILTEWGPFGWSINDRLDDVFDAVRSARAGTDPIANECVLLKPSTLKAARAALKEIRDLMTAVDPATGRPIFPLFASWPDERAREAGTEALFPVDERVLQLWIEVMRRSGRKPSSMTTLLACLRALEKSRRTIGDYVRRERGLGNAAGQDGGIFSPTLNRAIAAHKHVVGGRQRQAFPLRELDVLRLQVLIREVLLQDAEDDFEVTKERMRIRVLSEALRVEDRDRKDVIALIDAERQRRIRLKAEPLDDRYPMPEVVNVARLKLLRAGALLGVGHRGALRPAEIQALRVGDFFLMPEGEGEILAAVVRRSKVDQDGEEAPYFLIDRETRLFLEEMWREAGCAPDQLPRGVELPPERAAETPFAFPRLVCNPSGPSEFGLVNGGLDPTAPLHRDSISAELREIVRHDEQLSDRAEEVTGYSLRVGAATSLAEARDAKGNQIRIDELMEQLRHKTPAMSIRYIRQANRLSTQRRFSGLGAG